MASIDKAAIGFTIAIVAIGIGFAFYGQGVQDMGGPATSPTTTSSGLDPFAQEAAKIKAQEEAKKAQQEMERMMEEQRQMKEESKTSPVEVTPPKVSDVPTMTGPKTVTVTIPTGTAVPGCEETDECYIPASVSINAGDTVSWDNVDTAAHTVTSGTPTSGPDGAFDSSLLMAGATFEYTFDDSGSYDYFCMVHPWMLGDVQVN